MWQPSKRRVGAGVAPIRRDPILHSTYDKTTLNKMREKQTKEAVLGIRDILAPDPYLWQINTDTTPDPTPAKKNFFIEMANGKDPDSYLWLMVQDPGAKKHTDCADPDP